MKYIYLTLNYLGYLTEDLNFMFMLKKYLSINLLLPRWENDLFSYGYFYQIFSCRSGPFTKNTAKCLINLLLPRRAIDLLLHLIFRSKSLASCDLLSSTTRRTYPAHGGQTHCRELADSGFHAHCMSLHAPSLDSYHSMLVPR